MADMEEEDPAVEVVDTEAVETTEIVKVEDIVVEEMVDTEVEDRADMEATEEVAEEMAVDVTIAEKMVISLEIAQLLPKADHATNAIKPAILAEIAPPSLKLLPFNLSQPFTPHCLHSWTQETILFATRASQMVARLLASAFQTLCRCDGLFYVSVGTSNNLRFMLKRPCISRARGGGGI